MARSIGMYIQPDGQLDPAQVSSGPHARGGPDGSAMDAEGYLWNARWDGSCLLRLTPDGEVDRIIELPVSRPTSCVFGGPRPYHPVHQPVPPARWITLWMVRCWLSKWMSLANRAIALRVQPKTSKTTTKGCRS